MVSCYNDKSFLIKKNFLPTRYYSVDNNRIKPALNPWWVTGYTDAEGSFLINTFQAKTNKIGYAVKLQYQIAVHYSDKLILYIIKAFFNNVGVITSIKDYLYYRVVNFSDIVNEIIPHFDKHPLQSTKAISFYLFKASAAIMDLNGYK